MLPLEQGADQGIPAQAHDELRSCLPAREQQSAASLSRRDIQHGRYIGALLSWWTWPKNNECLLMVDDAHATGVLGPNGVARGHFGLAEKLMSPW